jgi:hypothetical protein
MEANARYTSLVDPQMRAPPSSPEPDRQDGLQRKASSPVVPLLSQHSKSRAKSANQQIRAATRQNFLTRWPPLVPRSFVYMAREGIEPPTRGFSGSDTTPASPTPSLTVRNPTRTSTLFATTARDPTPGPASRPASPRPLDERLRRLGRVEEFDWADRICCRFALSIAPSRGRRRAGVALGARGPSAAPGRLGRSSL